MSVLPQSGQSRPPLQELLRHVPGRLLTPVPLALLQPIFSRIALHVAQSRPELFARLGTHAGKRFLIDPVDLPFVLVLTPRADLPLLTVHRRHAHPPYDAGIAGTLSNLLEMIDGSVDGDTLFFSFFLNVTATTEAVVALRYALDDFEGSALESVVESFGHLTRPATLALSLWRTARRN